MIYVGIDNGTTATIGVVASAPHQVRPIMIKIPTFKCQDFNKDKKRITRVDTRKLYSFLKKIINNHADGDASAVTVRIEKPMKNPRRFNATCSGVRCLEAVWIVIEALHVRGPLFCASSDWQKPLLPKGLLGPDQHKLASKELGCKLFPHLREQIEKHKDADGLLIAEHARRIQL